jgi:hypothetical protein
MKALRTALPIRCILSLATVLGLGVALASQPAEAATRPDPARSGLYGVQDPTYDGVYRQGLTILALTAAAAAVDRSAVRWLRRQQCGNGRWTSFRQDLSARCGPGDSNATAMAVMALHALGRKAAPQRGLDWLVADQLPGGGWEYSKGWGADGNSTGLAVQALVAMGVDPGTVANGGTGPEFLASLQLGCGSAVADRGALAYQPAVPLVADTFATSQATQALAGSALPVPGAAGSTELPELVCPPARGRLAVVVDPAATAAGYLGRRLQTYDGLFPPAFGTDPDYGSTANAVLSLVAAGFGADQVALAMTALERDARMFVLGGRGNVRPAAASLLVLAERATDGHPRQVDGLNLVRLLKRSLTR